MVHGGQRLLTWCRAALLAGVAAGLLPCAQAGEVVRIGGSGTLLGTMQILGDAYEKNHPQTKIVVVANLGSSGGMHALLDGAIDIAVNVRPLKPAESKRGASSRMLGRTPFVFAVEAGRPETSITEARLVEIFSGTRQHWDDGTPIRLSLRPADDSDNDAIDALSPAMRWARRAAHARPGMYFAGSDQENADYVERVPGAVSGIALAVILSEQRRLRPLKLEGVEPTPGALARGDYRLYKSLHLVVMPTVTPAARRFLEFVATPHAKDLLRAAGVVPAGN